MAVPPFVFIHQGRSWFVPFALHQARWSDPKAEVVLLGDGEGYKGVTGAQISQFENDATARFRSAFKVMSHHPVGYELIWYLRWFYLLEFMEREGLEDAIYFDSDVLNYSPAEEMKRSVIERGGQCGITVVDQPEDSLMWTGCGHASYWTRDMLAEFCDFCLRNYTSPKYLEMYDRKMAWHAELGVKGGISDMTTLYLFWAENQDKVVNLAIPHKGTVVDHNVSGSVNFRNDEYEMRKGIKRIDFENKRPFLTHLPDQQRILAHSLHFQGERKKLMAAYYTGDWFPGRYSQQMNLALRAAPRRFRSWLRGG